MSTPPPKPKKTCLYIPQLKGKKLFNAARVAGHLQGESVYAQCLYCRDLNDQEAYGDLGYASLTDLTQALWDWSARKTHEMLTIAEHIDEFPLLKEAFRKGALSWTKLRLILSIASHEEDEAFSRLTHLTYRQLEGVVSNAAHAQIDCPDNIDADGPYALLKSKIDNEYLSKTQWVREGLAEGKVRVTFDLTPDQYAIWEKALDLAKAELYGNSNNPNPKKKADLKPLFREVIHALARKALSFDSPKTQVVAPANIHLHQCETCQRVYLKTVQLGDIPLNTNQLSRQTDARHIPRQTFKSVLERDQYSCSIPGCTNHLWLHIHHIHPWAQGGGHEKDNLVTLCATHHRLLHDGKVFLSRNETGEIEFNDRHYHYIGLPHVREKWPRPLDIKAEVEKPTARDLSILDGLHAQLIDEENLSNEALEAELEQLRQELVEERKDWIPGYWEYEKQVA